MKLKRWIRNWLYEEDKIQTLACEATPRAHYEGERTMNFSVTAGRGGVIVSMNGYDSKKQQSYNNLHIIPENEDIGQRVSEIVTLELLQRP
jgi:nitrate reductase alpha subunit